MMKTTPVILLLCGTCFFFSCKKSHSLYNGANTGVLSKSAAGDCMPIYVAGSYINGTALSTANYIEVQLNYTAAGAYQVTTDTVNGYYFRGQGAIPSGTATVRLQGHGLPRLNQTDVFTVTQGATSCRVNVTVL